MGGVAAEKTRPGHPQGRLIIKPPCAVCGEPSAYVELVPPGQLPASATGWKDQERESYARYHDPSKWRFIYVGVVAGNSSGDDITGEGAAKIMAAFAEPYDVARIRGEGFYDNAGMCRECGVPYCPRHWGPSVTGYGTCPKGHGKSLDPHWSPLD